ncbi:MAG: hypothetical protein ACR2PS_04060, partial [Pseudomonadales bacterium]
MHRLPSRAVSNSVTLIRDEQGARLQFVGSVHRVRTLFIISVILLSLSIRAGGLHAQPSDMKVLQPETSSESQAYAVIRAALEDEWAIDNHTHLVRSAHFDNTVFGYMPLAMRKAAPEQLAVAKQLFGSDDPAQAATIRDERIRAEGGAYWIRHLDSTRTRIALVNEMASLPDTGGRLLPIPQATYLLFPIPADHYPRGPVGSVTVPGASAWQA